MGINPLPSAEKKRRACEGNHPIREKLLTPKTWKAATAALEFILKLVNAVAKLWDMFG
jgi:hypothetical protein